MRKRWHRDPRESPREICVLVAGTRSQYGTVVVRLVELHMFHGYNRTMVSATVQYSVNVHNRVQSNLSEELHYYCQLLFVVQAEAALQYSSKQP